MKPVSIERLLLDLKERDISIRLGQGDRLQVSAPRGGLSSTEKEALSQRKAELLEFLREAQRASVNENIPRLVAVSRNTDLPLSFDQERMCQ